MTCRRLYPESVNYVNFYELIPDYWVVEEDENCIACLLLDNIFDYYRGPADLNLVQALSLRTYCVSSKPWGPSATEKEVRFFLRALASLGPTVFVKM